MAIVSYRPPTAAEVDAYRVANQIPAGMSQITLKNGEVVFYDYGVVTYMQPEFRNLTDSQKQDFIAALPGGTILKVPLQPVVVPDTPTPTSTAPAPSTPTPSNPINTSKQVTPLVNLAQLVTVDRQSVDRSYTKNSMQTIDPETIVFANTSNTVTVDVQINAAMGLIYSPANFSLTPGASQAVTLSFNAVQINTLTEGVSTLATTVSLSSNTVVDTQQDVRVIDPPPPLIVEPPPVSVDPVVPVTPIENPWIPIDTTPWIPELPPRPPIELPTIPDIPPPPDDPILPEPPQQQPSVPGIDLPHDPVPEFPMPVDDPTIPQPPFDNFQTPINDGTGTIPGESGVPGGGQDDGAEGDGFWDRFKRYFEI